MFSGARSVLGLDVGSESVKIVELTRRGRSVEVTAFARADLAGADKTRRAEIIRDLLLDGGFHSRRVVTAISGKSVVMRYLPIAATDGADVRKLVEEEAIRHVPFPIEECVFDFQRQGAAAAGEQESGNVLLVAARRTALEDHLRELESAGVQPSVIDVDVLALGNAYAQTRPKGQDHPDASLVTALLDIGAGKTSINIVRGSNSLFCREIPLGGLDFTQAIARRLGLGDADADSLKRDPGERAAEVAEATLPAIEDLCNEIRLSLDYFESRFEQAVGALVLCGGGSRLTGLTAEMERLFDKPVEIFDPFAGLRLEPTLDQGMAREWGPEMAVAAGLASRLETT